MQIEERIAIQLDLAAAAIACVAFAFSVVAYFKQRKLAIVTLRIQRDNDIIAWTNSAIDTIIQIEFLLRECARSATGEQLAGKRDELLISLSATIDKGRLYFPVFSLDVVASEPAPRKDERPAILNHLVEIYDLVSGVNLKDGAIAELAKSEVLKKKRAFLKHARSEVDIQRRDTLLKAQ